MMVTNENKINPYYFDGLKLLGTGNSTGLFGALVALNYFREAGPTILFWIKVTAAIYLTGICFFAISFLLLLLFIATPFKAISKLLEYAGYCALVSFVLWWVGTASTVRVLYLLW
jgi:hypothetical protein